MLARSLALASLVIALILTACTAPSAPVAEPPAVASEANPTQAVDGAAATPQATPASLPASARPPAGPESAAPTPAEPTAEAAEPSPTPEQPGDTAGGVASRSVLTPAAPSLAEALAALFPAVPTAAGEVILVTGRVLDRNGAPLPGAAVEFWQTDASGVYDHPGDRGTGGRDRGFQFYGAAVADADGRYVFRTIRPGYYAPRPRHIHVKVKLEGRTLLTTQFYFEEDRQRLAGEAVAGRAGSLIDRLILAEVGRVEVGGAVVPLLANDLVVDIGGGGVLAATPAQAEGPYYPVTPVTNYDNDLAAVP